MKFFSEVQFDLTKLNLADLLILKQKKERNIYEEHEKSNTVNMRQGKSFYKENEKRKPKLKVNIERQSTYNQFLSLTGIQNDRAMSAGRPLNSDELSGELNCLMEKTAFRKSEFRRSEDIYKNRIKNDSIDLDVLGSEGVKSGYKYLYSRLVSLFSIPRFLRSNLTY